MDQWIIPVGNVVDTSVRNIPRPVIIIIIVINVRDCVACKVGGEKARKVGFRRRSRSPKAIYHNSGVYYTLFRIWLTISTDEMIRVRASPSL